MGIFLPSEPPINLPNENAVMAEGATESGGDEVETIGPLDHVACTRPISGTSSTMSH